jgi:hypothetical protein
MADEEVDRIWHGATGGVLHRHKAHGRDPRKNRIEYGINRWAWQKIRLLTKTLPRKNSGKCALRAKIGDFAHVRTMTYQTFSFAQTCILLWPNFKKRLLRSAGVALAGKVNFVYGISTAGNPHECATDKPSKLAKIIHE